MARAGVLPCTPCAFYASSSAADVLRVFSGDIGFAFFPRCRRCMVVNDLRHACGSVVDDTLQCLLLLVGFSATVVEMLLLATTEATVHMAGPRGVSEALAWLF